MAFRLRCMASAAGGTSSCRATMSACAARIASSWPSRFALTYSWLNVATRSRVPPAAAAPTRGRKRVPKSARKTRSGSAVTTDIQRVRSSSAAGTRSSSGTKKCAAKMFENAIDQCAFGANDQNAASTMTPMQYRVAPEMANQRAVRAMMRVKATFVLCPSTMRSSRSAPTVTILIILYVLLTRGNGQGLTFL